MTKQNTQKLYILRQLIIKYELLSIIFFNLQIRIIRFFFYLYFQKSKEELRKSRENLSGSREHLTETEGEPKKEATV